MHIAYKLKTIIGNFNRMQFSKNNIAIFLITFTINKKVTWESITELIKF